MLLETLNRESKCRDVCLGLCIKIPTFYCLLKRSHNIFEKLMSETKIFDIGYFILIVK